MKQINLSEALRNEDIFDLIGRQWMLITAGTESKFNTMTASWGGFGFLWNRPVAFIFVRPERYTHEFITNNPRVTLSFYPEECRKALQICGTKSGRSCDKVAEAGLTPVPVPGNGPAPSGAMTFGEARMTIVGRKLFVQRMEESSILDPTIPGRFYDSVHGGLHDVYVLEIESIWEKE